MINELQQYLDFIKESMGSNFPPSEPFVYVNPLKWFRLDYQYDLSLGTDTAITLSPYFEIHAIQYNDIYIYQGSIGFYASCNRKILHYYDRPNFDFFKLVDDINSNDDERINFQFYISDNDVSDNNQYSIIALTNRLVIVINLFVEKFKQLILNDSFVNYIELINEQIQKSISRNQILSILGKEIKSSAMLARTNDYANNNILTFKHHVLDIGEKLEARVAGKEGKIYRTSVLFNQYSIVEHHCDCIAHFKYPGPCKHVYSLLEKYAFSIL